MPPARAIASLSASLLYVLIHQRASCAGLTANQATALSGQSSGSLARELRHSLKSKHAKAICERTREKERPKRNSAQRAVEVCSHLCDALGSNHLLQLRNHRHRRRPCHLRREPSTHRNRLLLYLDSRTLRLGGEEHGVPYQLVALLLLALQAAQTRSALLSEQVALHNVDCCTDPVAPAAGCCKTACWPRGRTGAACCLVHRQM